MTAMLSKNTQAVASSDYDTSKCEIGIVHIGYGAFHRAHQAVFIDQYMQKTNDLSWGIACVNLRETESENFARSSKIEDGYILKTTAPDGVTKLNRIRPHRAFYDWMQNPAETENLLAMESVHVVSITVTESGYYLDNDFSLNLDEAIIASEYSGGEKRSVYAFLTAALKKRQNKHGNPLNILCCDNIRSNGKMLEQNFKAYLAHLKEDDLLSWIETNVSFPCSMVDRITPRADDALIAEISDITGSNKFDPIHSEAFIQWVLEDKFKAPMPDLSVVGVEVVDDVDPYEEAKIRILNGGHTGLCYFGALDGFQTYDQAILDPQLRKIFDGYEKNEVLPGIDFDLPFDRHAYLEKITSRFSNSAIADQLERICMDGFSKFPIFIRPTVESCLRQGIVPEFGFLCIASWFVYAQRFANGHVTIPYHDPYWHELAPLLIKSDGTDFAQSKQLWANLPVQYPTFIDGILDAIREVEKRWPV